MSVSAYESVSACGASWVLFHAHQDKPNAPPLLVSPEGATVKFEDVKFGYTPDRTILDGLSFEAPAGKKIALVGGSGSGWVNFHFKI